MRESVFHTAGPGERCLLDHSEVREVASLLRAELIASGDLPTSAVAIQAIAFDKSATDVLYGISRPKSEVVALRLPKVT